MTKYDIHYESRELARELGDPLLGTVEADSPAEGRAESGTRSTDRPEGHAV